MNKKIIPVDRAMQSIHWVRGQKVLLDSELGTFYGVPSEVLNHAVKCSWARARA